MFPHPGVQIFIYYYYYYFFFFGGRGNNAELQLVWIVWSWNAFLIHIFINRVRGSSSLPTWRADIFPVQTEQMRTDSYYGWHFFKYGRSIFNENTRSFRSTSRQRICCHGAQFPLIWQSWMEQIISSRSTSKKVCAGAAKEITKQRVAN